MRDATLTLISLLRRWLLVFLIACGGVFLADDHGSAGVLDASWTAPTQNTDGSPLTDLVSYRVYYGPATAPCPGPAFFTVTSPTSSPAPGTVVSYRLTGLAT